MKRRDLLKSVSAASGVLALGSLAPQVAFAKEVSLEPEKEVDVMVVGGGTAGAIAALQAARTGAKTMLVEMGSQLGGTTTTGGVAFPGLFHAWGKQIIKGIGWEMVEKNVELNSGTMPDFDTPGLRHWKYQIRINGPLHTALLEEACLESGVQLAYYQIPLAAKETNAGWIVELAGNAVHYAVKCKQLIDCTGGANLVGMLGFKRLREETTQPGTLNYKVKGCSTKKLEVTDVRKRYVEAVKNGDLVKGDCWGSLMHFISSGGAAKNHIDGADGSTALTKTKTNIAGHQSMLRMLRFIRKLPGCENTRLEWMKTETAIRESYRILGETLITKDDYVAGHVYDDAVCYAFYPIDLHDQNGVKPEPLSEGTVPTVPLRALAPKGSRNLLVAGRCVSSDRLANSALRVQASCMAMGQAAGAAAALAASQNTTPLQVPYDELCKLLRDHNAIVPTA